MLMLSRVMMRDWIGIVMIRSDIRWSASTSGTMRCSPGRRGPSTRPSRNNTPELVLLHHPHGQGQSQRFQHHHDNDGHIKNLHDDAL